MSDYLSTVKMIKSATFTIFLGVLLGTCVGLVIEEEKNQGVNIDGLLKLRTIERTIDGSQNNAWKSDLGKSYTNIKRKTPARYQDGKSKPLENLPNPRFLSESVSKLDGNIVVPNEFNLTMLFGTFGQFLDHDITLSY
jgi:hypothetical protein